MTDISTLPIGLILIVLLLLLGIFSRVSKTKARTKTVQEKDNYPSWYKPFRTIMQLVLFLCVASTFFMSSSYLIWIGIGGLVVLNIVDMIMKVRASYIQKSGNESASINEQPGLPTSPPKNFAETMSYPTLDQPKPSSTVNPTQYKSIDHFQSGNTAIKIMVIFFFALVLIIGIAVWVLTSTGGLENLI